MILHSRDFLASIEPSHYTPDPPFEHIPFLKRPHPQ
jgi:hypothetical protein